MKLLHSVPVGNSSMTFFLPKGQYGTIGIEYDVDMAATKDLTRAMCGNVILNWNGDDVVNVDAELLNLLGNVYGGTTKFSSTTGAEAKMSSYITCGEWFDNSNVYDVGDNDRVYLKLDFAQLADVANVDSGNVRVYAKNKSGVMVYLHNIIARPVVSSGAATLADSFPVNNIAQVYLKDPASLLSNVQISKDGETLVDAPPETLIEYSDFIHKLETSSTTLAIDFVESLDVRESIGSSLNYRYVFTGTGTLNQYFSFIQYVPQKQAESLATAQTTAQIKASKIQAR